MKLEIDIPFSLQIQGNGAESLKEFLSQELSRKFIKFLDAESEKEYSGVVALIMAIGRAMGYAKIL
jgi:hypothetical protein